MTSAHHSHRTPDDSTRRLALSATLHCLTGCSIGEVLGMVVGTALHWRNLPTLVLSIASAFVFGYVLTMLPLRRSGIPFPRAARLALASDTLSITVMEVVDTVLLLIIPGAMDAHIDQPLFWGSLALALLVAGVAAYPVNVWLIRRGGGHALLPHHRGHGTADYS
jgi:hypothetical protein